MSIHKDFDGPYPLRLTATNAPLAYELYEVSACTLGILTSENLSSRDYLVMEAEGRRIPLRVSEILTALRPPLGPLIKRYRLTCLDCLMELDRLLEFPASGERPLQFPRCPVNPKVYVETRWEGQGRIDLWESVDISRSGLLLRIVKGDEPKGLPLNSTLPLRLDVPRLWLPESIQPVGRVVRAFDAYEDFKTFTTIAVVLSDFSQREAAHWTQLLRRIERGFLSGLTQTV